MKRIMQVTGCVLALALSGLAQTVFEAGQPAGPGRGGWGGNWVSRIARQLDLDEQQRAAFDQIYARYQEQLQAAQQAGPQFWEQMREARQAGDEARLEQLREQMRQQREAIGQVFEQFLSEIEPILRPEQVERLDDFRDRIEEQRQRGRMMGGRQLNELKERLQLTPEQEQFFDQLAENLRQQVGMGQGNAEAIRPLIQELRAAREAGDEQRVEQIRAQLIELRGNPREVWDRFYSELESVLTEQQKAVLHEVRGGGADRTASARRSDLRRLFQAAQRLDLTPEQKERLEQLNREATRALREMRSEDAQGRAALIAQTRQEIMALLTPEQSAQFESHLERLQGDRSRGRRR